MSILGGLAGCVKWACYGALAQGQRKAGDFRPTGRYSGRVGVIGPYADNQHLIGEIPSATRPNGDSDGARMGRVLMGWWLWQGRGTARRLCSWYV